jgi:hypothetical protein
VENIAAIIALIALVFTGIELAAPGALLRAGEPRDWRTLAIALVLFGLSAAFGVVGMLRGEGFIVREPWPTPPPEASDDATPAAPKAPAQQEQQAPAQQSDQSGDQPQANAEYPAIPLADLKLDRKRMIGKKVTVSGLYTQVGDMSTLSADVSDTSPVFMDVSRIPSDQQKALQECGPAQCQVDVEGVVGPLTLDIGVRAVTVTIRH